MDNYFLAIGMVVLFISVSALITSLILFFIDGGTYHLIGYCMLANCVVYVILAIVLLLISLYKSKKPSKDKTKEAVELKYTGNDSDLSEKTKEIQGIDYWSDDSGGTGKERMRKRGTGKEVSEDGSDASGETEMKEIKNVIKEVDKDESDDSSDFFKE